MRTGRPWLCALGFLVPLAAYVWTMADTWALDSLYAIDSAEMVIAAHTLGIDHPPGHPLYLILAHLFEQLLPGSADTGVIAASAAFGALAVCFLVLAIRERTGDTASALSAGLTIAFSSVVWIHASIAEVYAVQLACVGLLLLLAARWLRTQDSRWLNLLAFSLGLTATANLLLAVLMAPAALYLLARGGAIRNTNGWQLRRALALLGFFALGVTPLVYIPIRILQQAGFITDFVYLSGYEPLSFRWFRWYLAAEEFTATKVLGTPLEHYPRLIRSYAGSFALNASLIAAGLALWGHVLTARNLWPKRRNRPAAEGPALSRRDRRSAARTGKLSGRPSPPLADRLFRRTAEPHDLFDRAALLAFGATVLPVLSYEVPDRDVFFMPSFYLLAVPLGLALSWLRSASRRVPGGTWVSASTAFTVLVLPAYLFARNLDGVASITRNSALYQARLERFQKLPANAFIIGADDGHATRYRYFQIVLGLRPDVTIDTMGRLAPRFHGAVDLGASADGRADIGQSLNVADRLRILKQLVGQAGDRPVYAILDDRMPPEYGHFRTVRSDFDPFLLKVEPKPPARVSQEPLSATVACESGYFTTVQFEGFGLQGLDRGITKAFQSPLQIGTGPVSGIIRRGEIFELTFVTRRLDSPGAKLFAEFAFVNDRLEIPTVHEFTAAKTVELLPETVSVGSYYQDSFVFKIPGYVSAGAYTLSAKVYVAAESGQGSYRGKSVKSLRAVRTLKPWRGQNDYRPLGRIWLE